jgi:hypothetical protein
MQSRTNILTGITLMAAMTVSAAAMAADLPKEGTFGGTYAGVVTSKIYPAGKDRVLLAFDDNGLTLGNGFLDHMTWHCIGTTSIMVGMIRFSGFCLATDPAGDQIVADVVSDGTFPVTERNRPAKGVFTSGTGKFAGITGTLTNLLHTPDFRTAVEGMNVRDGDFQASYRLP